MNKHTTHFDDCGCKSESFRIEILELREQVNRYRLGHDRYEYLRTLNPRRFAELWQAHLNGEGRFDDLVDEAIKAQAALKAAEEVR